MSLEALDALYDDERIGVLCEYSISAVLRCLLPVVGSVRIVPYSVYGRSAVFAVRLVLEIEAYKRIVALVMIRTPCKSFYP